MSGRDGKDAGEMRENRVMRHGNERYGMDEMDVRNMREMKGMIGTDVRRLIVSGH